MHRHIIRWSVILGIAGTILLAVVIGIARILLPGVEHYRSEFEQELTQALERPVHIGALHLAWQGWTPVLRAEDIQVSAADGASADPAADFRLAVATLRIAVWDSLVSGTIQPARLAVRGVALPIRRHADGHFSIAGIDLPAATDEGNFPLPALRGISVADSEVWWQDDLLRPTEPALHFHAANLLLSHRGRHWHAQLDAGIGEGHIDLRAELQDPGSPATLQGRAYVRLDAVALPQWHAPGQLGALSGRVDGELWADFSATGLQHLQGHTAVSELHSDRLPALRALDARFAAAPTADGWAMQLADLHLDTGQAPRIELNLDLAWHREGDWLALAADDLHLARWDALLQHSPLLPATVVDALDALALKGTLSSLQASLALRETGLPDFHLSAAFSGLGNHPWHGIPGLSGISGTLEADRGGLALNLDSHDVVARFPGLFRDPLHADQLQGRAELARGEHGWVLRSDRLRLDNTDLQTVTRLRLDIPDDGPPGMFLLGAFRDGDGSHVSTYLPAGIMPDDAVRWLDRSLVSGRIRNGNVLFQGRFADFPFDDNSGRFEVRFNAEDMVIDYKPGWPRLEEVAAETRFVNRRMEVHGVSGKIFSTDLPEVAVVIPDLLHSSLHINGHAHGSGAEMLRFLMDTPLHDDFGVYFKGMDLRGDVDLDLSLYFPLSHDGAMRASGSVRFDDNDLRVADLDNEFHDLTGTLRFTGQGLYAKNVRASLNGRPLRVDVATDPKGLVTQVDLALNASLMELAGDLAKPLAERFPGRTDWRVGLGFQRLKAGDHKPDTEIVVRSDLRGIAIKAPPPFAKSADETHPFELRSLIGVDEPAPVRLSYGKLADMLIVMQQGPDGPVPRAADLFLGGGKASVPVPDGLRIRGHLTHLDLDQLASGGTGMDPDHAGNGNGDVAGSPLPVGLQPREIDVQVDRLDIGGQHLRDAHLRASRSADGWLADIDSDAVQGEVLIPQRVLGDTGTPRAAPLRAHLGKLHLRKAEGPADDDGNTAEALDPRTLPPLELSIDDLRYDDMVLGQVDVRASATPDGLRFERIDFANASTHGSGNGAWRADPNGQVCNIDLKVSSDDLGHSLQDFGFEDVIDGGSGHIKLIGGWDGSPADFAMSRFDGNLRVHFGDGRLLEVDPGAGGRVFGLFSLTALPRRLRLDFTDLFRKGFSFDAIDGSFNLIDGVAYTVDLTLRGPPAQVDIAGDTDFIHRTYNQSVTVTPRLGNTVAAASALVNPVVGAAVLVMNKLLKNPLDKASRIEYEMRGPWTDPQITRVGDTVEEAEDSPRKGPPKAGGGFLE